MPVSRKAEFRERADLLDFLLEVSTVTAETLDLDRLLGNVAEVIKDGMPYGLFAMLLLNDKTRLLRMRYSIGRRDEVAKSLDSRVGEGIPGSAEKSQQPMLLQ